jgi:hypothetical protein
MNQQVPSTDAQRRERDVIATCKRRDKARPKRNRGEKTTLARQDEPCIIAATKPPEGKADVAREGLAPAECESRIALLRKLWREQTGATTLEYGLLLAAIALPSYVIFKFALKILVYQYGMIVQLNSLPFP